MMIKRPFSVPRSRWFVLISGFLSGFILLICYQIPVLAFSNGIPSDSLQKNSGKLAIHDELSFINQGWFPQLDVLRELQLSVQATAPYPPPVSPTGVVSTPAYPPPVLLPTATKTPEEIIDNGVIGTPTIVPLPEELLTLEFPTQSEKTEVTKPDNNHDGTSEADESGKRLQPFLLILVSALWVLLGGWIFIIARIWQIN